MLRKATVTWIIVALCLLTGTLPPMQAQADSTITFYHLRIEFETSSDWSNLALGDAAHVLSFRTVETSGTPTAIGVDASLLAMNQSIARAETSHRVGMVVDYALSAEVANPLPMVLSKGSIHRSWARVYAVSADGETQLLADIENDLATSNDPTNRLEFTVDLDPTQLKQHTRHTPPKMLWAFYYPWYIMNSWQSPYLLDRPAEPYVYDDPMAIARQIDQAQQAGIDGFVVSWAGPDSNSNQILPTLLDLALARNFQVSIYFETLGENGPQPVNVIEDWLTYLLSTYSQHPAFAQFDDQPVVFIWASRSMELSVWQRIFTTLRDQGLDARYMAMDFEATALDVFDGLHTYAVIDIPDLAQTMQDAGRGARYYDLLDPDAATKLWIATAQPGNDDHLLPGRDGGLVIDRQGGDYYRSTFEAALSSEPDWIVITSWNEWWEHTYIEPSQLYGTLYLDITREYATRWKDAEQ